MRTQSLYSIHLSFLPKTVHFDSHVLRVHMSQSMTNPIIVRIMFTVVALGPVTC